MLKTTLTILFFMAGAAYTQPDTLWSRLYEGDGTLKCITTISTDDGGFLMGGSQNSVEFSTDFFALKTSENGEFEWSIRLIDHWSCGFSSITQTADGSFFLVGSGRSPNDGAGIVAKITSEGDSLWMRQYGGLLAKLHGSAPNNSGGIYIAGTSSDSARFGSYDGYFVNIDDNGEELWHQVYGGRSTDWFRDMIRTSDGGFAFAGETSSFGNGIQFYLVKADSIGEEEWTATFGDSLADIASTIIQTTDGGYALGGWGYQQEVGLTTDMMIVRVDEEGNEMWTRRFGTERFSERCHDLIQTEDSGFVLAGETGETSDIYLIRIDASGDIIWSTTYNIESYEECYTIIRLEDDSYILTGHTHRNHIFILRTAPDPASTPILLDPAFPSDITLQPAYPNPFNSTTTIRYSLDHPGQVTLGVYDLAGRLVEVVYRGTPGIGHHSVTWDASSLASGLYLLRMKSGDRIRVAKVALIR